MQIGGRAFDRHALPRDERALEFEAIGFRVAGVCHELSELRVTFAIDEGRVDDALHTLLPGVEGGQVNTQLVVQEVALRSEEHTSELQSLMRISYAVFCLKKIKTNYIMSTIGLNKLKQ